MEQKYIIYDYLRRDTGRSSASPDSALLRWNEFYMDVQCSIFDTAGRLLIMKAPEASVWNIFTTYCMGKETGRDAVVRLVTDTFGAAFPTHNLQYLRALKRQYTMTDLFELQLPEHFDIGEHDSLLLRFVTEEEFQELCELGQVSEAISAAFHYREMRALSYKNVYRSGWPRVSHCSYVWEYRKNDLLDGVVSLHAINGVNGGPSIKKMQGQEFTITDTGYYWLQYAPKDKNFWLTVMFDSNREIVQYYFDITYLNEVYWDGTAYFFDLFLDIVLLPGGNQLLLDEDELLEAYQSGQITKPMLDLAYDEVHRLSSLLEGNEPELQAICKKLLAQLIRRLENGA